MKARSPARISLAVLTTLLLQIPLIAAPPASEVAAQTTRRLPSLVVPSPGAPSTNDLATARPLEGQTLGLLLASNAWPRRAIAAVRLERFDDAESRELLVGLLGDPAWQVRCFAVRSLSRRGVPAGEGWFTAEDHPRVLRTALRYRYAIDPDRLNRGVRYLAKEPSFDLKMLAVELGATSTDPDVQALVLDTAKKIILRMDRADGGVLSPRLAAVTGQPDLRRHYLWQRWLMTSGRTLRIDAAYAVPEGTESRREPLSAIAALDVDRFADLVDYIESLRSREIDLAICLDTTASMHEELAEVQGGIDDLMLFVGDVVQKLQVGIVAYRDRRDRYETTGWDFTSDVALARQRLWELTADGGGDSPESVYPALRETLSKLSWGDEHTNILILIGDAPPHVGFGIRCVELASEAHARAGLVTHVIQTTKEEVKHFPQIAEAGHGRCVSLVEDDLLIPEIAGLTIGERFAEELRDFFAIYLSVCR